MMSARPLRTTRSRSASHNTRTVSRVGMVWEQRRVRCKRRLTLAAQRSLHAADAFIRNPLHQANVEANLVPLDDGALDLEEGEADRRLPVLGALEDQVVKRIAAAKQRGARQQWLGWARAERRAHILVFCPAYASGKW